MARLASKVTEKGQVTIPKALRDRLGIRPGEVLEFEASDKGRLVARKAVARDRVDAAYGVIALRGGTDQFVERLRGKADAS